MFYEVSSQIIPVLLLTLMVETRWLSDPLMRYPGRMRLAAFNMFLLAAGEYYALKGLVDSNWSEVQFAAVVASMSSGMVAIVATAIARPPPSEG